MTLLLTSVERIHQQILPILPNRIRDLLRIIIQAHGEQLQEIRIRKSRPLQVNIGDRECFVTSQAALTNDPHHAYIVVTEDMLACLNMVTKSSMYALEEEL